MTVVTAQSTSLYIPGFDPQPISADIVGVDSSGHTTWDLTPLQATDDSEVGFAGTGKSPIANIWVFSVGRC